MFVIEQSPEEVALAVSLNQNCEVESIRTLTGKFHVANDLEVIDSIWLQVDYRNPGSAVRGDRLLVDLWFQVRGGGESSFSLEIESTFQVEYSLRPGFLPSAQEIEAFASANALFHCWPYFREFVDACAARMNVPVKTLPFLHLRPRRRPGPPPLVKASRPTRRKS